MRLTKPPYPLGITGASRILSTVEKLAINDELYVEITRRAATQDTTNTALVEAALRSHLGLAALVDRVHERNRHTADNDVLKLAYQELDAYRAHRDAD